MKILIAVPTMDMVAAGFAQSLATLHKKGECSVSFLVGSLIYDARNNLAKQAISVGADYVMWFDSDMIFPSETLVKMLDDIQSCDLVSGVYYRRVHPFSPTLFSELEKVENGVAWKGYDSIPDEMFEIAGCGFGCVLLKTEMLLDMFQKYGTCFTPFGGAGEDIAFCIRARELGYKLMCDPSIKCGHVGHVIVTEELFKQVQSLR